MVDPVTIGLLAQAGLGAYQFFKGQSDASKLQRPTYEIPEEIKSKLSEAQNRIIQGLPEASKKLYIDNLQRSMALGLRNLSTRQAGIAGLAGVTDVGAQQSRQLAAADAAQRLISENQRRADLAAAQTEMAGQKGQAYNINQLQPYQQQAQASQALMGAGIQNLAGALQGGIGAAGQQKYIDALNANSAKDRKALMDLLNKGTQQPNAASTTPLVGPATADAMNMGTGSYANLGPNLPNVSAVEQTPIITGTPYMGVPTSGTGTEVPKTKTTFADINKNIQFGQQGIGEKIKFLPEDQLAQGNFQPAPTQEGAGGVNPFGGAKIGVNAGTFMSGYKDSLMNKSAQQLEQPAQGGYSGGTGGGVGGGGASAMALGFNLTPEKFTEDEINKISSLSNDEKAEKLLKNVYTYANNFYDKYQNLKKSNPNEAVALLNRFIQYYYENPSRKEELKNRLNK